ncbi:MAG: hypothetical protein ACRDZX_10305 [Acidimicrobiales bacterium]
MSWDWAWTLLVGAVGAGLCAGLGAAVRRESERLKLTRAEVERVRPRARRARADLSPRHR